MPWPSIGRRLMRSDPIVFEETRNRDGIAYSIAIRGKRGGYHATIKCPQCDAAEVAAKVAIKADAVKWALTAIDSHHSANHRIGIASLR